MQLFLFTLLYFVLIGLCVLLICFINSLRKKIQTHKETIDNLENTIYENSREIQLKARNIAKFSQKCLKEKDSIFAEILSTAAISVLPFKKLKAILYLQKLYRKL